MSTKNTTVIIGNIIHCLKGFQCQLIEDGYIIVQDRKIFASGSQSSLEEIKSKHGINECNSKTIILKKSQILIPGLIDTHIHAVQYPNCGLGYDVTLLDWLQKYTFKLEKRFKDLKFSKYVYEECVKETLAHGTTTACYFASLYEDSSLILADAAIKYGQRALIGKINMITFCPDDYIETPEESIAKTIKFVQSMKEKKSDLVYPVITPRFALSVDMDLMKKLGAVAKKDNLHIQSHISENKDEISLIIKRYHDNYTNVYDKAGLLTPKTVMAHGIYLSDEELEILAKRQTSIAHCPDSNTCLKSGQCDVRRLIQNGIKVGLGTDIAGGSTPSIVRAMKSALDTSIHVSFNKSKYEPLNYKDVFYLATYGGAEALALNDKIGNFEIGKEFDALIVDMEVETCEYQMDRSPFEILQQFIYLGDDRNILNVFVAGKLVK